MKKTLFLATLLLIAGIGLQAQTAPMLKKVMELKMPLTADDDMPGTRGASVTWHPTQKKFYASFAGNTGYPMGVFDATGKRLSADTQRTMIDTRGLWYNATTKQITGNGYDYTGWFAYKLNAKGIPADVIMLLEGGMYQPNVQSVGTYNPLTKQVLFLYGSQVFLYNNEGEAVDSLQIHWNRKKTEGPGDDEDIYDQPEDYNASSVVYTGIKGQELGVLNITNKEIELYDIKTGYLAKKLALPETAVPESIFNFAYANGIYWLFNIELRKWVGYK